MIIRLKPYFPIREVFFKVSTDKILFIILRDIIGLE